MTSRENLKVVICGGGIIGSSTAYYLAKLKVSCTIVEQNSIACAASGKAGGFLARNWCQSNECDRLAKLSFDLHMDLAKQFNDVDYRRVNTYSASINRLKPDMRLVLPPQHDWVDGCVTEHALLDTTENTAQVHPRKLCQRMVAEAERLSDGQTKVIIDTVTGLEMTDSGDRVTGVKLASGTVLPANRVLIAMGPWSYKAAEWLPAGTEGASGLSRIFGHRAHSILMSQPPPMRLPASCLFLQYRNTRGIASPEIYPRPDATVYVSGFSDEQELPETAAEVEVEKWRCTQLREVAYATCSALEPSEILAEQACYLPLSPDGQPVMGRIGAVEGLFIASAHSCWGILNSTGSGLAMAELIIHGQSRRINLAPFDPKRFDKEPEKPSSSLLVDEDNLLP